MENNTNKLLSIFKDMIMKYGKNEITVIIEEIITVKTHAITKSFEDMDLERIESENNWLVVNLMPDLVVFFDTKCRILEIEESFINDSTFKDLLTWSSKNDLDIEISSDINRVTNLVLIMDIFSNEIISLLKEVKTHEDK